MTDKQNKAKEETKKVHKRTDRQERRRPTDRDYLETWIPKTSIGFKVKNGQITNMDYVLSKGMPVLETGIVDTLIPEIQTELLLIGQSKGKFGGGARRLFKQTQKKTPEGNKPSFTCVAVVGNNNGYVGIGSGKSKDTMPAREKAVSRAKRNIFKIKRGCGSWECGCATPHSIPFKVVGKCGSSKIELMPAPKGKGLVIDSECAKLLKLAGIKDVWSKTYGQTKQKKNLIKACVRALNHLVGFKIQPEAAETVGIKEGEVQ